MNIYLKNGESVNPAIKLDTSPPSGYTISSNPTVDWDLNADHIIGNKLASTKVVREEIQNEYDSITWASGTAAQKEIWSRWFVATKAQRDGLPHTAAEQKDFFKILAERLVMNDLEDFKQAKADQNSTSEPTTVDDCVSELDKGKVKMIAFCEEVFGVDTAGRTTLSSTNQYFVSFAGVGGKDSAGLSFMVPPDYDGEGEFGIYWVMDGTGNDQGRMEIHLTQQGDEEGVYTDVDETLVLLDNGQTDAAWKTQFTGYVKTAETLIPGKKLHIELERDPSHGDDTMNDTFYLEVFVFKYASKR